MEKYKLVSVIAGQAVFPADPNKPLLVLCYGVYGTNVVLQPIGFIGEQMAKGRHWNCVRMKLPTDRQEYRHHAKQQCQQTFLSFIMSREKHPVGKPRTGADQPNRFTKRGAAGPLGV